jgi:hypothetical protein
LLRGHSHNFVGGLLRHKTKIIRGNQTMRFSQSLRLSLLCGLAALTTLATSPKAAHAQANLTISGGGGTPLALTLTSPVTYTIATSAAVNRAPFFNFLGVGNTFGTPTSVIGSITYQINGGTAQPITGVSSGYTGGVLVGTDWTLWGAAFSGVTVGDTVILNAGTLTTTTNIVAAAPANGAYSAIITSDFGAQLSGSGGSASAPEPGTLAFLALGSSLVLVKRRKK